MFFRKTKQLLFQEIVLLTNIRSMVEELLLECALDKKMAKCRYGDIITILDLHGNVVGKGLLLSYQKYMDWTPSYPQGNGYRGITLKKLSGDRGAVEYFIHEESDYEIQVISAESLLKS